MEAMHCTRVIAPLGRIGIEQELSTAKLDAAYDR